MVISHLLLLAGLAVADTTANSVTLTQKKVAELVLKSYQAENVNYQSELARELSAQTLATYDFKLTAESGFESSKLQSFNSTSLLENETYTTSVTLKKPFLTGTLVGLEYTRTSVRPDWAPSATNTYPSQTQDLVGLTLEQDLIANFFGRADRAKVRAAERTLESIQVVRADQLQNLVLSGIGTFWDTYVAQENFQESLNSRDRYSKLAATVKRKNSYGYTAPGEFARVQAELESREQNVKTQSASYLAKLDSLRTLLKLSEGTEITFDVKERIPALPQLLKTDITKLRAYRSEELKTKAAKDQAIDASSSSYPDLSLVGKVYSGGVDRKPEGSWSEMVAGSTPKYYVGLKLEYSFGSGYKDEVALIRNMNAALADSKMANTVRETKDRELDLQRNVQASYGIALSAKTKKDLLEKAAQELTKSYNQGRTDISNLIEALNLYFASEVALSRAVGDYQIALNKWAAFRDELIPDAKEVRD